MQDAQKKRIKLIIWLGLSGLIILLALWFFINPKQYTLHFESNGGTMISDIERGSNSVIEAPTEPTKLGYTFDAWYSDINLSQAYVFSTMPTQDTTLYAKWIINQYTLSFNTNGGSLIEPITQVYQSVFTLDPPSKEGYVFSAWYTDAALSQAFTLSTIPAENTTLYAKWVPMIKVVLSFNTNGGSSIVSLSQYENTVVTKPTDPSKTGYTFGGWYADAALTQTYSFTVMPTSNFSVYAKWNTNAYTISFNSQKGSSVSSITQAYNTNITKPINPTRINYIFDAWYSDSALTQVYTFTKMPAHNIQLYASWTWISNGLSYVKVSDHIEITGYTGDNPELSIPDEILNLPVTIIQNNAFYDNKLLTDVIIADTITSIGYGAFQWAENIETVTFESDSQLVSIGNSAFESDHALKTIEIPKSVTSLGTGAFSWTTSLESITFEADSQLISIGSSAFDSAHSLKTITIPSSVETIGAYAFTWNTSLESFIFEADSHCTSIGNGAFASDQKLTNIIIPASVVSLGNYVFNWDILLTSITFETGSQLESIGSFAFSDAQALSTIIIPLSVTSIGSYAFSYNLTPFTINVENASKPIGWVSDWIFGSGYSVVYDY